MYTKKMTEAEEAQYDAMIEESFRSLTAVLNNIHVFIIKMWSPFNHIAL